jgi:hypothetical protein
VFNIISNLHTCQSEQTLATVGRPSGKNFEFTLQTFWVILHPPITESLGALKPPGLRSPDWAEREDQKASIDMISIISFALTPWKLSLGKRNFVRRSNEERQGWCVAYDEVTEEICWDVSRRDCVVNMRVSQVRVFHVGESNTRAGVRVKHFLSYQWSDGF